MTTTERETDTFDAETRALFREKIAPMYREQERLGMRGLWWMIAVIVMNGLSFGANYSGAWSHINAFTIGAFLVGASWQLVDVRNNRRMAIDFEAGQLPGETLSKVVPQ